MLRGFLAIVMVLAVSGCTREPAPTVQPRSTGQSQPIMPVDDVRPGMRGYGLSVFRGTEIEPFAVEVISVALGYEPNLDAIWIQCTDPRMQLNGPVQGMSGSPIYLWDDGEPRHLGQGGRLIGAFAFGFSESKICYIGVQPIEQMRDVGSRASVEDHERSARAAPGPRGAQTIRRLLDTASAYGISDKRAWRAEALGRLIGADKESAASRRQSIPGPSARHGAIQPMLLPVNVGSSQLAQAVAPLLAPAGLIPMDGAVTGQPPPGVDLSQTRLEPGSVLAIPFAWGATDMAAAGTVTDVLPDGRVLAFGHAMDGVGDVAMPMATGYVHFVMPRLGISFKIGGSGIIQGAIVRDESAAVVGSPLGTFQTSPLHVTALQPDQPVREYEYTIIQDKQVTPIFAAILAFNSLTAVQQSPVESTLQLKAKMEFEGGYELTVDSMLPGAGPFDILFTLLPPLTSMVQNNLESRMLTGMTVSGTVRPDLQLASIAQARLDRAEVAPGEKLGINLTLQPYHKPAFEHRMEMSIPDDLDDGAYQLIISDARTYLQAMLANRPHLMMTRTIGDLHAVTQRMLDIRENAIYATLQLPEEAMAVGQLELPRLPSSRRVLIASPASTVATPYRDSIQTIEPMDIVINGDVRFVINIDHTLAE